MGILIEVTSGSTPQEWDALAAFVAVMQGGKPALLATAAAITSKDPKAVAPVVVAPSGGDIAGLASDDADEDGPEVEPVELPVKTVPEGVEVDTRGLPWDGRIHASTKTKTKAQEWTAKRNVDPALVAAVEAELRQIMAAPAAPVIQVEGNPAPAAPPPPPASPPASEGPPAAAPPPPPNEAAAGDTPFTLLLRKVVAKQASGAVSTSMTNEIAASLGLTSMRDLANRPDLIPAFEALLP